MSNESNESKGAKRWKYELYFPHKAGARNDPKLLKVFSKHRHTGIGIYWMLMEILRESEEFKYPIDSFEELAIQLFTQLDELQPIIDTFIRVNLIASADGFIFSNGLTDNMKRMREKSEKAKESVAKRWNKRNTNVSKSNNDSNTDAIQVKNSIVNPSKEGLSILSNSPVSESSGNVSALDPLEGSAPTLPDEALKNVAQILRMVDKFPPGEAERYNARLEKLGEKAIESLKFELRREFLFGNNIRQMKLHDLEGVLVEYELNF
jgi:hypothetical protein